MANSEAPTGNEHGRYVEGQYGRAGVEKGHTADDPEGRYVEGDYGTGGTEDAAHSDAGGRFVEADYGTAGNVPGRAAGTTRGSYVKSESPDHKATSPQDSSAPEESADVKEEQENSGPEE